MFHVSQLQTGWKWRVKYEILLYTTRNCINIVNSLRVLCSVLFSLSLWFHNCTFMFYMMLFALLLIVESKLSVSYLYINSPRHTNNKQFRIYNIFFRKWLIVFSIIVSCTFFIVQLPFYDRNKALLCNGNVLKNERNLFFVIIWVSNTSIMFMNICKNTWKGKKFYVRGQLKSSLWCSCSSSWNDKKQLEKKPLDEMDN